jgi:hypothetical protein
VYKTSLGARDGAAATLRHFSLVCCALRFLYGSVMARAGFHADLQGLPGLVPVEEEDLSGPETDPDYDEVGQDY